MCPYIETKIGHLFQTLFLHLSQRFFCHSHQWARNHPRLYQVSFPSSLLKDALVYLLGIVRGVSSDGAHSTYQRPTEAGAQPIAATPRFEVLPMPVVVHSVVAQPVVTQRAMFSEKQKILGRFFILTLNSFIGASSKDTYQFLVSCEDKLYNFGLADCIVLITLLFLQIWYLNIVGEVIFIQGQLYIQR